MGKRARSKKGDGRPPGDDATTATEGQAEAETPAAEPFGPDGRLREVSLLVEEVDYVYQLYRWIIHTGEVPKAQEWLKKEPWPHPDYVIDVFGSWEKFLAHAGVPGSPLLARVREADAEAKDLAAREKQLVKELARVDDLRRQVESARSGREAAQAERDEQRARAERLQGALEAAQARAAAAERTLHDRAQEAAAAAPDDPDAGLVALRDELDAVRAHREELLGRSEALEQQAVADARTIARLSTLLAEAGAVAADATNPEGEEEPPETVLAAVERAAATCAHLVFTDAARSSAADSPYRRPQDVLDALRRLDELGALHADPAGFGRSLTQAATELGLTYKGDVSEIARSRNPHDYTVTHDGHRLELGPHVALGSGSGAGFIARIYLHVADGSGDVPRGIYVGHVGRHLPDTTT
ncbi:hypothetical protein [Paraconexibacter algicola]|uniref:Uncharacterized protein n=1 Tax=Paraconexibacter algicola TaxID=2133960 RepID=A0A2T4UD25_9ACTN|nr:hypothetical protein [Paraconexibacter algicola]PTL55406.1 hypothetical protein C7Y72_17240 [Paraconexibacter algicola]